jgi:ubiquinone/menaquinone biosynthesis C-methylase UbiE
MRDFTIETYDRTAMRYAGRHWSIRRWSRQYRDFERLLEGRKILDVGCGPGRDSKHFLSKGYAVVGTDKSKGMIAEARKRVPEGKFRVMDMLNLKIRRGSFNGIWCCASLLHIKKSSASKVMKSFRRILKKNGLLFLSLKMGKGEKIVLYPDCSRRFFSFYTVKELEILIEPEFTLLEMYADTDDDGDTWLSAFARPAQ